MSRQTDPETSLGKLTLLGVILGVVVATSAAVVAVGAAFAVVGDALGWGPVVTGGLVVTYTLFLGAAAVSTERAFAAVTRRLKMRERERERAA